MIIKTNKALSTPSVVTILPVVFRDCSQLQQLPWNCLPWWWWSPTLATLTNTFRGLAHDVWMHRPVWEHEHSCRATHVFTFSISSWKRPRGGCQHQTALLVSTDALYAVILPPGRKSFRYLSCRHRHTHINRFLGHTPDCSEPDSPNVHLVCFYVSSFTNAALFRRRSEPTAVWLRVSVKMRASWKVSAAHHHPQPPDWTPD